MFNFAEPAPVYLAGTLLAAHLLVMVMPAWLEQITAKYAVLRVWGRLGLSHVEQLPSLLLHGFLHASWMHLFSNSFMIIVLGIAAIRGARMRSIRIGKPRSGIGTFWGLFVGGVIAGGLAQWLHWALSGAPLGFGGPSALGASGGASALFAAGGWAIGGAKQMWKFAAVWALINAIMVATGPYTGINLAWAAHIGGFLAGMILSPLLVQAKATRFKILNSNYD